MATPIDPAIQRLLDDWLAAVQAGDVEAIVSHYADDLVAFDASAQLQFVGREAYAAHWRRCLAACEHTRFERHQLAVEQGGDIAFGHYLAYCGGRDEQGREQAAWTRASVGLRRVAGRWMIVHEHFSLPFDMHTLQPLLDAQP
ncbi:YybH family protein [Pseudomonas citronellolis]|uniref:YybH family protein n=1 Tax=Pseudomonas citronellolis TaxID=53408 RepID=UPI0023E37E51|nr:nuclear transport factor 2 family protein [Pseudomonas citronellolis]MDF3935618.1 nuclear transport factor 2 family protein [Pseudomonas citronellolis]